jgi:prepilin-type N-terminal cleavage/methylation domain-containing protein
MQLRRAASGFSLVELAVVLAIVALLVGGAMATLSSQVENRNQEETRRRLEAAVEALIGYAIVNRRLPCPATATGDEALASGTPATGGPCTTNFPTNSNGFLPARTIGIQQTDSQGYAVDAWNNRIRFAVANAVTGCTGTSTSPHFTSQANLKANGVSCRPNDLVVCASSVGINASSCNAAPSVTNQNTVAFIVFSTGKNGAIASAYGPDETANLDGDPVFVSRPPSGSDAANGAYDDIMLWVPVGVFYGRLIAAGVLP